MVEIEARGAFFSSRAILRGGSFLRLCYSRMGSFLRMTPECGGFCVLVTPLGFKPKTFRTGSGGVKMRAMLVFMRVLGLLGFGVCGNCAEIRRNFPLLRFAEHPLASLFQSLPLLVYVFSSGRRNLRC